MLKRIYASHMGAESCLRNARDILLWSQMWHDIKNYVSQCEVCNELQPNLTKEPMMFHSIPERPWRKVAVDVFALYNRDYSVIVDFFFSDCWELDELNSATSANIVRICKHLFAHCGIPDELICGDAAVFTSPEFATFARTWEFCHTTSFPYYSRLNRKAESLVNIAKRLLTKCMCQKEDPWKAILNWWNKPNERLGTSPAQRLMSRRTQTMLPAEKTLLNSKIEKVVPGKLLVNRLRSRQYYDRVSRQLFEGRTWESKYTENLGSSSKLSAK